MSDYLVKEALDFAETVLLASVDPTRRGTATIALYRGMFSLSPNTIKAALQVLNDTTPKERVESLRGFVHIIRREIGATPLHNDDIDMLWGAIIALPSHSLKGS